MKSSPDKTITSDLVGKAATAEKTVEGVETEPRPETCRVSFRRDAKTGRMQAVMEGKCSPDDIAQVRQAAAGLSIEGEHSGAKEESTQPEAGFEGAEDEDDPAVPALEKDDGSEHLAGDTKVGNDQDMAETSAPLKGEEAQLVFSLTIGEGGVPVLSSDDCDPALAEEVIKLLREEGAIFRCQKQALGDSEGDEEGAELKKVTTTTTTKRMYEKAPSSAGGPEVPAVTTKKEETVGRKTKGR